MAISKPKKLKEIVNYAIRAVSASKSVWWSSSATGKPSINDGWTASDDNAFITPDLELARKTAEQRLKDYGIKNIRLVKITMERSVITEEIKLSKLSPATVSTQSES